MTPVTVPWELIVVNNGSSDDTDAVAQSFADRLPVRVVTETKPGLSHARNAGVHGATGEYIVWTDDDVRVDADWLQAYVHAFERWPDVVAFGGRALPCLEAPSPPWLLNNLDVLRDMMAKRDFGEAPLPFGGPDHVIPFGLNYAVRADVQRLFPYDPALGVAPGRRTGGEETKVLGDIAASGYATLWIPDPVVEHVIPSSRQTEAYVFHFYEASGEMLEGQALEEVSSGLFAIPRWRWKGMAAMWLGYRLRRSDPAGSWVPYLVEYALVRGWIRSRLRRWWSSVRLSRVTGRSN